MKNSFKLSAAIIGLGVASLASASTYSCVGTIDFVSVSPTGMVTVSSPSFGPATSFRVLDERNRQWSDRG